MTDWHLLVHDLLQECARSGWVYAACCVSCVSYAACCAVCYVPCVPCPFTTTRRETSTQHVAHSALQQHLPHSTEHAAWHAGHTHTHRTYNGRHRLHLALCLRNVFCLSSMRTYIQICIGLMDPQVMELVFMVTIYDPGQVKGYHLGYLPTIYIKYFDKAIPSKELFRSTPAPSSA